MPEQTVADLVEEEKPDVEEPGESEPGESAPGESEPEEESPEEKPSDDDAPGGEDEGEALLERAKEYGLSQEDLDSFGDKAGEVVDRFAQMFDERVAELGRNLLQKEEESGESEKPSEETPPVEGAVAEKLKEAGYDEDLIGVVQALESEITALKDQVTGPQEPALEQVAQQLGAFFENPPERFKDVVSESLGGKSIFDLPDGSKEREFVNGVISEIDALHAGYAAQGKELPVEVLGERALAIVCKDKLRELSERELAGKIKRRGDKARNEPASSGRDTKQPTTREDEVKAVKGLMQDYGFIKQGLSDFLS